jgi:gliding motility-associated-like protein
MKARIIIAFLLGVQLCTAQQITYRKIFSPTTANANNMKAFDGRATPDGAYVFTGLATFSNVERPILVKTNCKGDLVWAKNFGNSGSWNNIFNKVINTNDGGCIMLHNTGTFQAYNILAVKVAADGTTQWRKIINNGQGNDMGQSIRQTSDGGYIICGATNSYGSDVGQASYTDAYIVKLDATGNIVFSKTFGTAAAIDDLKDIIQTKNGDYAFTGTILAKGCFNVVVGKLSSAGALQWVKAFGDTLSRNGGYNILENSDGDLFVSATSTLHNLSPSFNSDISHLIMRVSSNGTLVFGKIFNGTANNGSDNSLSLCYDKDSNLVIGTETMSYPSTGFTPNKQVAQVFNRNGGIIKSLAYNSTGSQYTRIHNAFDGGFTLSGFGTIGSPTMQRTYAFKLDSNLRSTCGEQEVTPLTLVQNAPLLQWDYVYTESQGANITNTTFENSFTITDTTLCENYPAITASYTAGDTCLGNALTFTAQHMGAGKYIWLLGNGDTIITATNILTYQYDSAGTYLTTLIVTNGCDTAIQSKSVTISGTNTPLVITPSINNPILGQIVSLSTNISGSTYTWSDGSTSSTLQVNQSGTYSVAVNINGCISYDTIVINFAPASDKGSVYIPNAITPNNDKLNDDLVIITSGAYQFKYIRVFNRWGQKVFESKDINYRFNGKVDNELMPTESFYYVALFEVNGVEEIFSGDILVIR